jgi:hypothetical protein
MAGLLAAYRSSGLRMALHLVPTTGRDMAVRRRGQAASVWLLPGHQRDTQPCDTP